MGGTQSTGNSNFVAVKTPEDHPEASNLVEVKGDIGMLLSQFCYQNLRFLMGLLIYSGI